MENSIGILIKFNDNEGTTMSQHLNVLNKKGQVIWGQSSDRIKKLSDNKVESLRKEITNKGYIYIFFVSSPNIDKKRDVYVGRCINLLVKGDSSIYNKLEYIPKYYSNSIGQDNDNNIALFEIDQFIYIDQQSISDLRLNSNKNKKVMEVNNMTSLFYVSITNKMEQEISRKFELKNMIKLETDENYQSNVEKYGVSLKPSIEESKGKCITKPSEKFRRDPARAKSSIIKANYKCEVDAKHELFISKVTGENYVEAHHLVPIQYSELFNGINIDVEENIISLCVICHKKLHHGNLEDITLILTKLYNDRIDGLKKKGISITLEELITLYI